METKVDFGQVEYAAGSRSKGWYQYGVHGTEVCGARKTGLFIKGDRQPTRELAIKSAKDAATAYKAAKEAPEETNPVSTNREASVNESKAPRFELLADHENNSEAFWEAFYSAFCGGSFDQAMRELLENHLVEVSEDECWQLLGHLKTFPGWSDPEAPAYAPHPVIVRPL